MFDNLKKKIFGFFKKKEEPKEKEENKKKSVGKPKEKEKKDRREVKIGKKKSEKITIKKEIEQKQIIDHNLEENLKEKSEKIEEEVPVKFETSQLAYEPDLETIKEGRKEVELELTKEKEEKSPFSFFSKLKQKLTHSTLSQEDFEEIFQDLEITLLENNVALSVIDSIKSSLSSDLVNTKIERSKIDETILESLKSSILSVLKEPPNLISLIKEYRKQNPKSPFVILLVGINGSGKTTSIAKLAHYLKKHNISVVLGAGDTFRAASIEQLEEHANKLNVPIVKKPYDSDPASVAFDTIAYAKSNNIQVALIDTAGRMYTKTNLIKEMEKIVKVSKPNLKLFVGESITGNDATEQAKAFNDSIDIDGIILSKADVDEKAGTILSVSHVTNKPIFFLGTGQSYDDLEPFTKKTVLKNIGLE